VGPVTEQTCTDCGGGVVYQSFGGGREWYCPACDITGAYDEDAERPPRVQMLADGHYDELRADMHQEIQRRREATHG
jgi:hypothetical protein